MIEIGKFNRKGTIQRRVLTPDALGEDIESWTDYKEDVWTQVMPISARQYINAEQIDDDVTHILRFRYIPGLVSTDRFVYCGRIFNFSGAPINYQERSEISEVRAIEVPPEPDDDSS